jgi:hypothetical protein
MAEDTDRTDTGDGEWRFSLSDVEQRDATENGEDEGERGDEGNVAGALSPDEEIKTGDIDVENALFVVTGVALAVLAVVGFANVLP